MAVENAPEHERIWIEDIYQNIFCGTSQGTRKQADGIVAVWRKMFARPAAPADRMGLGRVCSRSARAATARWSISAATQRRRPRRRRRRRGDAAGGAARGRCRAATGFGLRDIGTKQQRMANREWE